jgi:hypothetical protein
MVEVRAGDVFAHLDPGVDLLQDVSRGYQLCLRETPKAMDFFHRRGLTREGLLEHFEVGYADRRLARYLPAPQSTAGKAIRRRLAEVGLYRETGHGHFHGCLTFPIYSADGRLVDLYGRKLGTNLVAGTELHVFRCVDDADRAEGVFNIRSLSEPIVLTDSPLNAISFWSAGVESVTCNLTRQAKRVLLAYRNTERGNALAEQARTKLTLLGIQVEAITLPAGMDANDVLRRYGPERLASAVHETAARLIPSTITPDETTNDLGDIVLDFDNRQYRVRGLQDNTSPLRMKINLKATRDELFHVHLLDLYSSVQRRGFIRDAAAELYVPEELIKRDLGQVLRELEAKQERMLRERLAPQKSPTVVLSDQERHDALRLLESPDLIRRIQADFELCGLVGEDRNGLLCYLACTSRLLDTPLSVLIQSSSAAGKTTLMDRTLALMPTEMQVRYSAMTSQSLYYLGREDLKRKILAIAEEEGVAQAAYALKLLQSEGKLQIAVAGKDDQTGRPKTQLYSVEGPVAMLLTTTCERPDEELANRCLVIHVNESPEQTAAIQAAQRRAYRGECRAEIDTIRQRHRNAQRILEPYPIIIPDVDQMTFRHDQPRMRRDHAKFLTLIASVTLLHQYQRTKQEGADGKIRLVATKEDVDVATHLIRQVLDDCLADLLPRTRELLRLIATLVDERREAGGIEPCFTQRQLRETFGWGDFAIRRHLARLVELEWVQVSRGTGNQRRYQLVDDRDILSQVPDLARPSER